MPVTARLSQKFYETFGDEIANELVEWFNAVDLTYRTDLRELADLQYARFDARLELRFGMLEARFEHLAKAVDSKVDQTTFDERIERLKAELRQDTANLRADLLKWMFLFWLGSVTAVFVARVI